MSSRNVGDDLNKANDTPKRNIQVIWVGKDLIATKTVWKQAKRYGVPRIAFMHEMDKIGADFGAAMQTIKEKLDIDPIRIQFPVGEADGFRAIVDLVTMQVLTFSTHDKGNTVTRVSLDDSNLTDDIKEEAREAISKMIGQIADHDETLLICILSWMKKV